VDLQAMRPALDSALEDLGTAARDRRPPRPPPQIDDKTPAGVRLSRQLAVLHSAVERLAEQNSSDAALERSRLP